MNPPALPSLPETPYLSRRHFLVNTTLSTVAVGLAGAPSPSRAHHLCVTCGSQFAETSGPPERCPICLDERQYVGAQGQEWTTLEAMRQQGKWTNAIREQEPGLVGIGTEPKFGIGQRALLLRTPKGNILWDCVSFLD